MRIVKPYEPRVPNLTEKERAARAAIERAYAQAIPLTCGHYTYRDTDEGYACWRPNIELSYCENCHQWVKRTPRQATTEYPDEPPF